jgi:signal transduction histidine kinase/ActR/RegA family two-component response regulator
VNADAVDAAVGRWSREFGNQGVFTTDARLIITSWNRWLERHSGIAAGDVIGQSLASACPDLAARGLDERYREALEGKASLLSHLLHGHLWPLRPGGEGTAFETMPQRARIAPLTSGQGVVGTITIIEDVSERLVSELELRKQIAAQQAARLAAEEAVRVKDDFLAMLGHELRNPLAPILTALELLKLRGVSAVERERAIIERQVKHLVSLVDDLLDISRIARGKLELRRQPVEIATIVAAGLEIAAPLLEQRKHRVTVRLPSSGLVVDGDAERLTQVVANLLTNAATCTGPGGAIDICGAVEEGHVVVRVRDTGIGMDQEMLSRIFDPFVQARQSLARSRGGLGLGLAIVRTVLALHGGGISAASAGPDRGSTFTIRLPLMSAAPRPDRSRSISRPASDAARVLVVDDNADAAVLLADMLSAVGYTARFALDGPSALQVAAEFDPDITILDIGLPGMDGYELAGQFASSPRLARTRLVAVTGYGQERDRQRAQAVGFVAHLVKPVELGELSAVLQAIQIQRDRPELTR